MEEKTDTLPTAAPEVLPTRASLEVAGGHDDAEWNPHASKLVRFYSHPWTQIVLVSFIFFCLPGVRTTLQPRFLPTFANPPRCTML